MPNLTEALTADLLTRLPGELHSLAREAQRLSGLKLSVSTAEAGLHAWSACLPGQALIHPGPDGSGWAHELAHVLVAAEQNCVRPVALSTDPAVARPVWLIFNAACDLFVDQALDRQGLLLAGHRTRAANAYQQLTTQHAPQLGLPRLARFYQDHAAALQERPDRPASTLGRRYQAALEEGHGLEPLTTDLLDTYLGPDGPVDWIRMDDLNSQATLAAQLQKRSGKPQGETSFQAQDGPAFAARLAVSLGVKRAFALLMWDVAGLGRINAAHGAATGDQVLERHGQAVAAAHRQPWYRVGGDESYLMLDEALPADRTDLLQATLLALAGANAPVPAELRLAVVFFPHDGPDLQTLLRRLEHRAFAGTLDSTRSPLMT